MLGGRALAGSKRYVGGVAAALVVGALAFWGVLEPLELWSLDRFFEIRGPRQPTAPIVIVGIDESSFVELNQQWPFARALHGDLIRRIAADKPLAIGVDLIFDVPSGRGAADDEALGKAVTQAGNVVLGAAPRFEVQALYTRKDLNLPVPVIRKGAAGVGAVDALIDSDSHIRRTPLRVRMGDETLPTLDTEMHRLVTRAGYVTKPLPDVDEIIINFNGPPRTFPWISYSQVVMGDLVPAGYFRGKIVYVGPTSETLHDVFPTAFATGAEQMPGVEIHANVLETYIRGNRVRAAPAAVSTLVAAAATLMGAALVVRLFALRAFVAAALMWVILTVFAYVGFLYFDVWVRGMAGTLGLLLGYGVTVVEGFVREQRERRRLSQFFSPEVLREVVRHRDETSLGSTRKLVTVLFSDIRGFTSLSEKLEPEEVAEMLREYLTEMTEIVFRHRGTVDKYIGDCVMALYNVPFADADHAVNAVRTALAIQEKTLEVSKRWEARRGVVIRNGVGIHTGDAVVGTMGSRQRLEYTAVGDTINLGSRLEALTKEHGVSIIVSESTQRLIGPEFLTRELGDVKVRGKAQPVKIYAVLPGNIRQHPRVMLETAATLVLLGAGETCVVTTRDVSEGGMALGGVPAGWVTGTKVEIRCEGGLLPAPLLAEAVIAWRRDDVAGITFADAAAGPAMADYVARRGGR